MDIRVLRYFLAVAREKNITRAAKSLHITQPSLSKQLMDLEENLGKQLLIRGKREITLTEDGLLLKKRAEEIIDLVEKTEQEISTDENEIIGHLYLGGNTTPTVLNAISQLNQEYPDIQFHFYSGDAIEIGEKIDHGTLDFAIMLEPIDNTQYDFLSLPDTTQWGILMDKTDPLATNQVITNKMIKQLPLILHQRIGLQQNIAHWAETDLDKLHIVATYNILHGDPIYLIQHHLGYYLTTRDLLGPTLDEHLCFIPLSPQIKEHYALVWKKHTPFNKIAKLFLKQIKTSHD